MVIFFDTETSGLYPGNICQLSYIIEKKDGAVAKNFFFTVDYVDYNAYMVHGLSVEKLKVLSGGKRFLNCIEEIEGDFNSADVVVAHNYNFDCGFMRTEFSRCERDYCPKLEFCSMKKSIDICKLNRKGFGYKYPKLSELCEYYGITEEDISQKTKELFSLSSNFHDARFDTVALFLAINKGIDMGYYEVIKQNL